MLASELLPAVGIEVGWVDPCELVIGANVRTEVVLSKSYVRDIGRRGVREPIIVRRDEEGRLVVRKGQKRTLAAVQTGQERVLVLVEPELATGEAAREVDRIVDQLGENEHRAGISQADELRATQQLLDLGVKARAIARMRSLPLKRVQQAVAAARCSVAAEAVTEGGLDLAQAAVLAEFEDDDQAVVTLTDCARTRPDQFDHLAQRLRDRREEARLRTEKAAELTEQGVTVIDRPDTLYGGPVRPLSELRATPKTKPGTTLSVARHATCPGHAAFIEYHGWRPAGQRLQVVFVCTDFAQHGHAERHAGPGAVTVSGSGVRTGKMTEEQKAERRRVIKNGKDWDSATTVRLDWLKTFAKRRTPPRDAAAFVAEMIAQGSHRMRAAMEGDHTLALELLGLAPKAGRTRYDRRTGSPIADAAASAAPTRATMLTVVMLLAALEKGTDRRHSWDQPPAEDIAYFTQLRTWGYPLSEVEQLVLASTASARPGTTSDGGEDHDATSAEPADEQATQDSPDAEESVQAENSPASAAEDTAPDEVLLPEAAGHSDVDGQDGLAA